MNNCINCIHRMVCKFKNQYLSYDNQSTFRNNNCVHFYTDNQTGGSMNQSSQEHIYYESMGRRMDG